MELLKDLECVEVLEEENGKKLTLTFLYAEAGEVRSVSYNTQKYDNGKYVDDKDKKEKTEKMFLEDTGLTWDMADQMNGQCADVYDYGNFCSLHEVDMVEKFTEDMKGEIYDTEIKEIVSDDYGIKVRYDIEGKTYETKFMHGKYIESLKQWMKDPVKRGKQEEKFKEKFGVPVEEKDSLIGRRIMVEVKCAFKKFYYGEIKRLPKKK